MAASLWLVEMPMIGLLLTFSLADWTSVGRQASCSLRAPAGLVFSLVDLWLDSPRCLSRVELWLLPLLLLVDLRRADFFRGCS